MIDVCFNILMDLIKYRKITAKTLSERYEVSTRSVYRYLDILSEAGVAIFCERGRSGGIMIADSYRLPASLLTESEQKTIFNALNLYKGANPNTDTDKIRDKILAVNPQTKNEKIFLSGDKLMLEGVIGDERMYRAKISPLTTAIDYSKKVQIIYHDRGGKITNRIIEPHAFVLKDYVWYVYAFCELRNTFRMFKISRIEKLLILSDEFVRRPQSEYTPWNLDFYQKSDTVDLELYVNENARYAVEEWLGVENVSKRNNPDFPYIAISSVVLDDNLIAKLLSFAGDIDIVSPKELKKEIVKKARNILALYNE